MSIILSPSSSLQFRFLRRWASSITTQRHGTPRSSGQSARIISKVVITAWKRYAPFIVLPCKGGKERKKEKERTKARKRKIVKVYKNNLKCLYPLLWCSNNIVHLCPFPLWKQLQNKTLTLIIKICKTSQSKQNKPCRVHEVLWIWCMSSHYEVRQDRRKKQNKTQCPSNATLRIVAAWIRSKQLARHCYYSLFSLQAHCGEGH